MRFFLVDWISLSPKRLRRSTTGTIFPRRLITPSTKSGDSGTAVISGMRTISCTSEIGTPKLSRPIRKPTICNSLAIPRFLRSLVVRRARCRVTPCRTSRLFFSPHPDSVAPVGAPGTFDHKAVHGFQHGARHARHLLGGRRQLG